VVASSVVGIGGGRRRWHHVHWAIVRQILAAWVITLPITAVIAMAILALGRLIT
jgi:PiT family inorganic phosphate transporter